MATWAGPPRAYTKGRSRPVQYVVIHSTEGSEGINSAEAGVAYDKVRTDGTSTHLFIDADTALMEVRYADTAHAARTRGNACGIQVELCGRAGQTATQWHDAASLPMLRLAAREVAAICKEFDLPVRRLSVAEVRAAYYAPAGQRPKGICGHVDVTAAYPEDQGTHTDPGPNFPWSEFLAMVSAEMGGSTKGDDMDQSEKLARPTTFPGRTVGDVLADLSNLRTALSLAPDSEEGKANPGRPQPGSLLARLEEHLAGPAVQVDATAVASALAANTEFLAALARAVNDDAARRLAN